MSNYDQNFRRQIRASMMSTGFSGDRADQAVDLACHAADKARDAFVAVVTSAPDGRLGLSATELGAQLVAHHFSDLFKRIHEMARTAGLPTASVEAEPGR